MHGGSQGLDETKSRLDKGRVKMDERQNLLIIQETREDIQKAPNHHTLSTANCNPRHAGATVRVCPWFAEGEDGD